MLAAHGGIGEGGQEYLDQAGGIGAEHGTGHGVEALVDRLRANAA